MLRFSEWLKKLEEQHRKVSRLSLVDITETVTASNKVISITLGKELLVEVNGETTGSRFLRALYTNNKDEFTSLLESLTKRADEVSEAIDNLLEVITEEAIPEVVVARMKGEKVSGDPVEILESMCKKRFEQLRSILEKGTGNFASYQIGLRPVGIHLIHLAFDGASVNVGWGDLAIRRTILGAHSSSWTANKEQCLQFIGNFETIKERIEEFVKHLKEIRKLAEAPAGR